jgi:hypothetical protein
MLAFAQAKEVDSKNRAVLEIERFPDHCLQPFGQTIFGDLVKPQGRGFCRLRNLEWDSVPFHDNRPERFMTIDYPAQRVL